MADHIAVAPVRVDDHISSVLQEQRERQSQDAQESALPVSGLLLHKVSLAEHCIQLQDGQLLCLPAACSHRLQPSNSTEFLVTICGKAVAHMHA